MSERGLDPELLRAFIAVAERRSFTRAAVHLNRTQATVSLQIKRLEDRIGVMLFRRSTVHVEPTAAAETFLPEARQILKVTQHALAKLANHKVSGRVRLGVMEDYGTRILPRLLAEASEHFPLVEFEMEIGLTAPMLKRRDSFDAVIAMHAEGESEGEFIRSERALWVRSSNHSIAGADPLPVALSGRDCLFRSWATDALNASGRAWRLAYISHSLSAVEALVREGLAITVLKASMVPSGLHTFSTKPFLPQLPAAEIRLHRPTTQTLAAPIVDHLVSGLRAWTAGVGWTV